MPSNRTSKMLFQRNVAITGGDSVLYKPPSETTKTYVRTIWVCNTSGSASSFSLFVNQGANSSVTGNAIYSSQAISANTTQKIEMYCDEGIVLHNNSASLIARAGAANVIVITGFGAEVEET